MTLSVKFDSKIGCCYVKNCRYVGEIELHVYPGFTDEDLIDLLVAGAARYNYECGCDE